MFQVLYQDQDLIAINKPAGWLVHRTALDPREKQVVMLTLRDQIQQHVFPVHRLDRPTSGVLVFALSSDAARRLSTQFELLQVKKSYHALVRGQILKNGTIDYPLVESQDKIADRLAREKPAQSAITHYFPQKTIELPFPVRPYQTARYSLITLQPVTGRKHQLRRHMHHIFHPIIGDTTYGDLHHNRAILRHFNCQRLMLHASEISFIHPYSGIPVKIQAHWDDHWQNLMTQFHWSFE